MGGEGGGKVKEREGKRRKEGEGRVAEDPLDLLPPP